MHSNKACTHVLFPTVCLLSLQIVKENGLCLCRWVFPCCSGSLPLCSGWGSALGEKPSQRPERGLPAIWNSLEHKERCQQEALKWLLSAPPGEDKYFPWFLDWGNFPPSHVMHTFWALYFIAFNAEVFAATYHLLNTLSTFEEFPTVWVLLPHVEAPHVLSQPL